MASSKRRARVERLMAELAAQELGEGASALDWFTDRVASGVTIAAIAREIGEKLGPDWNAPGSGPWSPSRNWLNMVALRLTPDARDRIAEARKVGAAAIAEQALQIADDAPTHSTAEIQKARLRADVRDRLAAAFDPQTFGRQTGVAVALSVADLHIQALTAGYEPQRTTVLLADVVEHLALEAGDNGE